MIATSTQDRNYILFGENSLQAFWLGMRLSIAKGPWYLRPPGFPAWMTRLKFFQRAILEPEAIGNHKGIWYKLHETAIQLTARYYDEILGQDNTIEEYYNRTFKTDKFAAYLKDSLVYHCFKMLIDLYMTGRHQGAKIHLADTPLNRFIVEEARRNFEVPKTVCWIKGCPNFLLFIFYIAFLMKNLARGFVFNKAIKAFKVCKEAASGFHQQALADDLMIDGERFKKEDLLLVQFNHDDPFLRKVFEEVKQKGYATASVPRLPININCGLGRFLYLYLWVPFYWLAALSFSKDKELYYYLCLFHKTTLPLAILMNHYSFPCFLSSSDVTDNDKTIIFNTYGAKLCLVHWSDIVSYKGIFFAFNAYNLYLSWGDIHRDFHGQYRSFDRASSVGCIFKETFRQAVHERKNFLDLMPSNFDAHKKVVAFFDTSFHNHFMQYTEEFYLKFIQVVIDFCQEHPELNVIFKPKKDYDETLGNFIYLKDEYKSMHRQLLALNNLVYLQPGEWNFEVCIALSDVIVSMSMNSTSTVALTCGKDALYYDITGNMVHPIARDFFGTLVFDSQELLFKKIEDILAGRFRCADVLKDSYIRQFDAFDDDKALDRIRQNLYQLTNGAMN